MHKQRHPTYSHTFIDSCAFDSEDLTEEESSRRLIKNADENSPPIIVAHSVQKEIDHPNTPADVKVLAQAMIFTNDTELSEALRKIREKIRVLMRGNAEIGKHENDADHLFELYKFGGGYFITTDQRILSKSEELFSKYFVTALRPTDYEALL